MLCVFIITDAVIDEISNSVKIMVILTTIYYPFTIQTEVKYCCPSKGKLKFYPLSRLLASAQLCKSYSHFFSKNISIYAIFNDQIFNHTFNSIVSFEQLGPVLLEVENDLLIL